MVYSNQLTLVAIIHKSRQHISAYTRFARLGMHHMYVCSDEFGCLYARVSIVSLQCSSILTNLNYGFQEADKMSFVISYHIINLSLHSCQILEEMKNARAVGLPLYKNKTK